MTKFDFILAQFRKTHNKKYENYVVERIYNLLDDESIKFITQQYVQRPNGKYALLDLYFPQLDYYIEIDEGQHKNNITSDELRFKDIIQVTNFIERRIIVYDKNQADINIDINNKISEIRQLKLNKLNNNTWIDWDITKEMNPDYYINLGYIDSSDNVLFENQNDAFKCFGKVYDKPQFRCAKKHPTINNNWIWCPKFFEHKDWYNEASDDYSIIKVVKKNDLRPFTDRFRDNPADGSRMVFGHIISPLGGRAYKFLGYYEFDYNLSIQNNTWTYVRKKTRVETLKPIPKKEKRTK